MKRIKIRTARGEFIVAGLSTVIAIVTGVDWMGEPLRLVHVVTLVAAGMVAGAALMRALARSRQDRTEGAREPAA
jgi:hypothetical protein